MIINTSFLHFDLSAGVHPCIVCADEEGGRGEVGVDFQAVRHRPGRNHQRTGTSRTVT